MASQNPPVKGAAYTLYFTLFKNDGSVIGNPGTITKLVAKDGGGYVDTTNAVTEVNTTYGRCSLVLTATEMTADHVAVYLVDDTSGCVPLVVEMDTPAQTLDHVALEMDNLAVDVGLVAADVQTIDDFLDTEIAAIKAKTDTIGAVAVTITNPVAADRTVTVTEGDDYDATHGLQIIIPVADSSHLLGLDDPAAVVKLVFEEGEWTASGVASTAAGYDVTFEPTATETGALTKDRQDYQLRATLADADITTRTSGTLVRTAKVA